VVAGEVVGVGVVVGLGVVGFGVVVAGVVGDGVVVGVAGADGPMRVMPAMVPTTATTIITAAIMYKVCF
jgi:hypothetical protein